MVGIFSRYFPLASDKVSDLAMDQATLAAYRRDFEAAQIDTPLALLDLDDFRLLNQTLGHDAGEPHEDDPHGVRLVLGDRVLEQAVAEHARIRAAGFAADAAAVLRQTRPGSQPLATAQAALAWPPAPEASMVHWNALSSGAHTWPAGQVDSRGSQGVRQKKMLSSSLTRQTEFAGHFGPSGSPLHIARQTP